MTHSADHSEETDVWDDETAEQYIAKWGKDPTNRMTVEAAGLGPEDVVVDVGCGGGEAGRGGAECAPTAGCRRETGRGPAASAVGSRASNRRAAGMPSEARSVATTSTPRRDNAPMTYLPTCPAAPVSSAVVPIGFAGARLAGG